MTPAFERLIRRYAEWLASRTAFTEVNGAYEITTPFLDRHNDRLQIYVQPQDVGYRLTDDGYIISDLAAGGCQLDTTNRKQLLTSIVRGFGVNLSGGELYVETSTEDFPRKKHMLIQAMLAINDLFVLSKQRVHSLFVEDVKKYLDANEVRYTPDAQFTGKSGYPHRFDYVIPKSKSRPERLVRAINTPSKDNAMNFLFAWTDTKDARPENSLAYAILNDEEKAPSKEVLASFTHYGVKAFLWSKRDKFAKELAL